MVEQTINYGLVKPAPDEFYDVSVPNRNMEIIDSKMKELETKKAEEQDLTTLSNTVSRITDGTAIKEMTLPSGANTVAADLKSPVNVKRIDGKTIVNLPPLFDSGTWKLTAPFTLVGPNEITITPTTTLSDQGSGHIFVKPNTQHILNAKLTNAVLGMTEFTNDTVPVAIAHHTKPLTLPYTFTTKSNTGFLRIWLYETALNVKVTFKDITLVEGSQAQPFVANVKGVTNPTIANETNGTSLVVPTTLYAGEYVEEQPNGELVKYKKWQEVDFSTMPVGGGISAVLSDSKQFAVPKSWLALPTANKLNFKMVKYNGSLLVAKSSSGEISSGDQFAVNGDKQLIISILNTDSGFGPNYTPTPEELKAFLLGWTMYHVESGNYNVPYNGTGTKAWVSAAYKTGMPGVENNNTTTLPTTKPTTAQIGTWKPYRLIYELATPVQEIIQPYSDLTLEKGENSIKVYAGRIVNEGVKPYNDGGGNVNLNNSVYIQSQFKRKVSDILSVYRNSNKDSTWIKSYENSHGLQRLYAPITNFDQTSSYAVDYEPLYTWEVTAPIESVQLQYFETLVAVTNELVHDVAKQQDTVKRMLENLVNEDEGIVWIKPTLLGGFAHVAGEYNTGYYKDSSGNVVINLFLLGNSAGFYGILKLPKGYRPLKNLVFPSTHYTDSNTAYAGIVSVGPDGTVYFVNNYATGKSTHVISLVFKAEQ